MRDAIPETMRAVVLTGHGGLDRLESRTDCPVPRPGPGEVLIAVGACGLNNTDVNTRTAWYSKGTREATTGAALDGATEDDATWGGAPIAFPRIQGADVVGRVVALGEGADPTLMGRRVMVDTWLRDWDDPMNLDRTGYFGSEIDGGFAEFTKVDARNVHAVESALGDAELATFATASITAENMLNQAGVGAGDTVLVPGASGGVGSALIQLPPRRGATTVAMAGAEKADQVRAIWPALIDALARGGRYACSGAIAGPVVEFDLRTFDLRDLTLAGATIVPPGVFVDLVGYIERGEIRPLLAAGIVRIRAIEAAREPEEHVPYDVNRGWTRARAIQVMTGVADLAITIEQPCESLDDLAAIRRATRLPISVYEALTTVEDGIRAAREGIAEVFDIRINRVGGLLRAARLRDIALAHGIEVCVTATGGSVLADAEAAHLAETVPQEMRRGIWGCQDMLAADIAGGRGPRVTAGRIALDGGPGLGVAPEPEALGTPLAEFG